MIAADMQSILTDKHRQLIAWMAGAILVSILLYKYFWTFFAFDVPLGYDAGIYRYLLLRYAEAFPVFPTLDGWAREQPMGLFLLFAPFLKFFPVELVLGPLWNAMPVLLALALAWVIGKREGRTVAFFVLLMSVLSIAQYHGFLAMYWKTFAALLTMIFAFHFLEKKSWVAVPFGVLTIAMHQQTGFLFLSTLILWILIKLFERSPLAKKWVPLWIFLICAGGVLSYIPLWNTAVGSNLRAIFSSFGQMPAGSFESLSFFLFHSGILLALGFFGLVLSFRRERGTLWQCAAILSFLFVISHFFFYRRFILQMDFFLLPFAAYAVPALWRHKKTYAFRTLLIVLILVQGLSTAHAVHPETFPLWCSFNASRCKAFPPLRAAPEVTAAFLEELKAVEADLPDNAMILSLEPQVTPWLRGWLPHHRIAGPGIFSSPWDYDGWERFLLGTNADRRTLLKGMKAPMYLFVTPLFTSYYQENAEKFLNDPCFEETSSPHLLTVTCL